MLLKKEKKRKKMKLKYFSFDTSVGTGKWKDGRSKYIGVLQMHLYEPQKALYKCKKKCSVDLIVENSHFPLLELLQSL